jgi:branched-chain amino acid transport system substrate-binding protein
MLASGTGKALTKAGGDLAGSSHLGLCVRPRLGKIPARWLPPKPARSSAGSNTRSTPRISPRSCCRRNLEAKVIGLANADGDTTNAIKRAAEFGIVAGGQKLAALLLFVNDVHS